MIVQKYGGTSVATIDKIKAIALSIKKRIKSSKKIIVVVSAISGETGSLIALGKSICQKPNSREMDQLVNIGENKTVSLLSIALNDIGVKAISLSGWQAGIITDSKFCNAFIKKINSNLIKEKLKQYQAVIVAGFQGVDKSNNITTLGKGGSDTTAVALASAFNSVCEIYTDVDGVFSADPRLLPSAKKLPNLSYDELMEMSANGAKVMETRSVEIAKKYKTKIIVAQSLGSLERGTKIMNKVKDFEFMPIKNITAKDDVAILKFELEDESLIAPIIQILSDNNQKLELSTLLHSDGKILFSVTINNNLIPIIEEKILNLSIFNKIKYKFDKLLCKIALVGSGFSTHSLIAKEIFQTLFDNKIEVKNISISEISIVFTVAMENKNKAIEALSKTLNLGE